MRWPFEDVLEFTGPMSIREAAARIGVQPRQVSRWKASGMTTESAERVCDALRVHPLEIWPDWYDAALEGLHVACEASDCDVSFIPAKPTVQRFCSPRCRRRERMRRYRATPHGKATTRKWSQEWYAANRERVIAEKRAFRAKYPHLLAEANRRYRSREVA